MEEFSVDDPTQLLESASDYAYYAGTLFYFIFIYIHRYLIFSDYYNYLFIFYYNFHFIFEISGVQNDASAKEFLDRFPLPVIIK